MRTLTRLILPGSALLLAALWGLPASGQTPADPNAAPAPAAEAPAAPTPENATMPAKEAMPAKDAMPAKESMAKKEGGSSSGQGFSYRLDPLVIGVVDSHVDNRSAKFEEYRDTSNGFVLPLLHIQGESADGNRTLDLLAQNVRR